MNYSTKTTFESRIAPGLVYTLLKMTARRRAQFNAQNAAINIEIRDLARAMEPTRQEMLDAENAAKLEPCKCEGHEHEDSVKDDKGNVHKVIQCAEISCPCRKPSYRDGLLNEHTDLYVKYMEVRRDKYYPALIAWAVSEVAGLTIDERPVTKDTVLDLPGPLVDEVGEEIDRLTGLSSAEQLGFSSPGTSSAPEAGLTSDISADTAK